MEVTLKTHEQQKVICLELKYCERCGGLWLRPAASPDVNCPRCVIAMQPMAPPTRHKNKARIPGAEHSAEHSARSCREELRETVQKDAAHGDAAAWTRAFGAGGAA